MKLSYFSGMSATELGIHRKLQEFLTKNLSCRERPSAHEEHVDGAVQRFLSWNGGDVPACSCPTKFKSENLYNKMYSMHNVAYITHYDMHI